MAADLDAYRATRTLVDTPRWRAAADDADIKFPRAANIFACALGFRVSADTTPALYSILQRTTIDAGQSTSAAKEKYQRGRPFVTMRERICVPEDEHALRAFASYPSGHASLGWTWALILAELAPDRADAVLARGYAFGQSRVICGVHWQSDVDAGRTIGAAVYARLHAEPEFIEDMATARKEAGRARAAQSGQPLDCAAEADAFAASPDS